MTQHIFGRIKICSDNKLELPVYGDGGAVTPIEVLTFDRNDLIPMLVEVVATYNVKPVTVSDIIPSELTSILVGFPKQFPGVELLFDEAAYPDKFVAEVKNGDTGVRDRGFGDYAIAAVADLATSHGFKSTLPTDGKLTITDWFVDFQYGFQRISDEILQAEMDEMYAPEKGAW